jgi:hypothetical protein
VSGDYALPSRARRRRTAAAPAMSSSVAPPGSGTGEKFVSVTAVGE